MSAYTDYYRRTIEAHLTGLKLVLGGTGLGKTSSLAALLAEVQRKGILPGVKLIYVANRIQLLDEMVAEVRSLGLHIHQKRDSDHLRECLADGSLASLLTHSHLPSLIAEYNRLNQPTRIYLETLQGRATRFERVQSLDTVALAGVLDLSDLASDLLRPLKELLARAQRTTTVRPTALQELSQRDAAGLAALPVWRRLFPYLRFQEEDSCRLLLLTVQKAFHGVFDGQRTQRLGSWAKPAVGRYVFVFDEFDFLENDLLTNLTNDREVSDPFNLVQTFYERIGPQKLAYHKYLAEEPRWQPILQELNAIHGRIGELKTKHEIDFPAITHFITKDKELGGRAIFQSNYSLVRQPVYLAYASSRPNSFELTTERLADPQQTRRAFVLLGVVNRAVKDIIRLFKRLELEHEDIYPELLRQCFGNTAHRDDIRRLRQTDWGYELYETNYGSLLANGFGLYEIEADRSRITDPEEVAIGYYSLSNSPEAMMRAMGRRHLLFGLSATAHIPRVLRSFDWAGLAHPADSAASFGPLDMTAEDQHDIEQATQAKTQARGNTITHQRARLLDPATDFGQQLTAILRSQNYFGNAGADNYRCRRVQHFFGLLVRLAAQHAQQQLPNDQMHLVFLASVRQVEAVLQTGGDEEDWFGARLQVSTLNTFRLYEVWCRDAASNQRLTCHVVLYDAQLGQDLRQDRTVQEQYNALFWDGRPVLVVTTYASAGNGINLQYYQTPADYLQERKAGKRDFRYLHLLDAPYYYFSGTRHVTPDQVSATIKRDVYGMMKLLYAKRISEGQAAGQLGQIRHLDKFNGKYLEKPDGVLNQFSVFVQALGRIERVWEPMPNQEVWLDENVARIFARVANEEAFASDYRNYLRYASANMRALLASLTQKMQQERDEDEENTLNLHPANEIARKLVDELLTDIDSFKRSGQPAKTRERWQQLREEVLKHDMSGKELRAIKGTFQTSYARNGVLNRSRTCQLVPPETANPDFEPWTLNAVYRPLTRFLDSALAQHFRVRGYELAFVDSGTYFLPYVYQSILIGAVGEEAVGAALKMRGIVASGEEVPDALFEVADLRVKGRPVFIDCKNYGTQTQRQFALPPDDRLYHPTLNEASFQEHMARKWRTLSQGWPATPADPCRLLILNLVHDDEAALRHYDEHFAPVTTWAQARITVLTGVLRTHPASAQELLTPAFTDLTNLLNKLP